MMQSAIGLTRLKFSTTKMQYAQDDQVDFIRVVIWVRRVTKKEWTIEFGQCGAK